MKSPIRILFVCTGNICRSPSGERLAAALNAQNPITGFRASSAGTRAVIAHPVHPEAARVLADLGGDPADFGYEAIGLPKKQLAFFLSD